MKKSWTLIPVLALALACQNEQEAPQAPVLPQAEDSSVFYATMESPSDATKVYADDDLRVLWNENDRVSIFVKDTGNQEYVFSGQNGDNAGSFALAGGAASGEALPYNYAVYPYSAETTITAEGVISFTIPAVQAYRANTFGQGAGVMVAVAEDNFLAFKNVGSFLALRLYGEGISVSGITLRGNKDEILAGPAAIRMDPGGVPSMEMAQDGVSKEIRLTCAEPVALGADSENATTFWFVLPPTDFEEGFTITVEDSQNNLYVKSTSNPLSMQRSHLRRMKAFEFSVLGFGFYPVSGTPFTYQPATDQMNIYEMGENGWFRFLAPNLKMHELGPIPLNVTVGDTFTATLAVTTAGVQNSSQDYELTARSFQDGKLVLVSQAGDQFIIRF